MMLWLLSDCLSATPSPRIVALHFLQAIVFTAACHRPAAAAAAGCFLLQGPSLAWGPWAIVRDADGKFGGDGQPPEHAVAWQGAPNLDHSNAQVCLVLIRVWVAVQLSSAATEQCSV
jgi:hypothetical protein